MELRRLDVLPCDQTDTQADLDEYGEFGERGEPPQGARAEARPVVGRERPQAREPIADDDEPGPPLVDL
ncbi:MAG: hypothetical protein JO148_10460 [Acidimicrobiia bacterium]|nr:hypothetical protein [Acidimicrobiia bacterium]